MDKTQILQELKRKLQEIKAKRTAAKSGGKFSSAIEELLVKESESAKKSVSDSPTTLAIRAIAEKLSQPEKKDPRIKKIISVMQKADKKTKESFSKLSEDFDGKVSGLLNELRAAEERGSALTEERVSQALSQYEALRSQFQSEKEGIDNRATLMSTEMVKTEAVLRSLIEEVRGEIGKSASSSATSFDVLTKRLEELEKDLRTRLAQFQGGGNMNRNIAIGGNQSVLSMFNDINLKAGNNTTITYQNNLTTGFVDVTITATGGGAGVVREIIAISSSQGAAAVAGTDYVYLASGNTTLTLPSASGNENLYTVKNVGVGTVVVNTTGGETIDGGPNATLAIQYTSVDLISDSSNWNVT